MKFQKALIEKKDRSLDFKERIKSSSLNKVWEKIGVFPHHGINTPLFSLHSKNSCGIGEFLDLQLLIDFCHLTHLDIIQLLPLNDSGSETSPYNALSSKALNPIYLSLHALPYCKSDEALIYHLKGFKKYTHLQRVPYNAILSAKMEFLSLYYHRYFQIYEKSPPYLKFLKENQWVYDYGLFKALKEEYCHKKWSLWKKRDQKPSLRLKKELIRKKRDRVDFFIFLQFLAFSQFDEVKTYAEKKGVFIKGDIPILVSPESVDVWAGRNDFNLNYTAGAPKDTMCPQGQNWGFPIYNWSAIEFSDYRFWKERLRIASRLYDLYRVDHIIGLFSIFAIPKDAPVDKGAYQPLDLHLSLIQGSSILKKLISFSPMLPIGEDLGLVREGIKESMAQEAIAGTKIPRWEKKGDQFIDKHFYPPISLTTVSTHDSETLTQWWNNSPNEAKLFAESLGLIYNPHLSFSLRFEILKHSHRSASLFHINLLSEYLALFEELVSALPDEERINRPGFILPSNWCYKTRPSLETLLDHTDLKNTLKKMVA